MWNWKRGAKYDVLFSVAVQVSPMYTVVVEDSLVCWLVENERLQSKTLPNRRYFQTSSFLPTVILDFRKYIWNHTEREKKDHDEPRVCRIRLLPLPLAVVFFIYWILGDSNMLCHKHYERVMTNGNLSFFHQSLWHLENFNWNEFDILKLMETDLKFIRFS